MAIYKKKGSFPSRTEIKIIKPARVQFDKMENTFFSRRLNETNKAQKVIDLNSHLLKFEEDQDAIEMGVARENMERKKLEAQQKQERRSNQLNELQRAQAFREDWEQKGYENWVKNQKVKHNRLRMVEKFKHTQALKKDKIRERKRNEHEKEVYEGIDAFERNLAKFGLGPVQTTDASENGGEGSAEGFGRSGDKKGKPAKMGLTFKNEKTIEKIRQRKRMRDLDAKERDKRRRKMIVDQNNSQMNFEIKKREEMLIEKLQ